jgi:hypothetical protein
MPLHHPMINVEILICFPDRKNFSSRTGHRSFYLIDFLTQQRSVFERLKYIMHLKGTTLQHINQFSVAKNRRPVAGLEYQPCDALLDLSWALTDKLAMPIKRHKNKNTFAFILLKF